jgi:hypothetical protein
VWNNRLNLSAAYLAGKVQPFLPPQFQAAAVAAEAEVAGMTWQEVVSQPTIGDQAGRLHFVVHGSAAFVCMAAAGEVRGVAVIPR